MSQKKPFIKAIETRFGGKKFRSRLEARWAVFFSAIKWKWFYEHEGYNLPSGNYLPDFYFPELNIFAEVKPDLLTPKERKKCIELSEMFPDTPILLLIGYPSYQSISVIRNGGNCIDAVPIPKGYKYYPLFYSSYTEQDIKNFKIDFEETSLAVEIANEARFEFESYNK